MANLGRRLGAVAVFCVAGLSASYGAVDGLGRVRTDRPPMLHATGLYAGGQGLEIAPDNLGFAPQYPLWSDGASKRRWIWLPPGARIDARDPDAWEFPAGTKFWKEFSLGGTRVETRYMERLANGTWAFAAYAWDAAQQEAALVGEAGRRNAYPLGEGRFYGIPSLYQCAACHLGGDSAVLGFSALQLSPDRDPGALHVEPAPAPGLTLDGLAERGLVAGLGGAAPRMPGASATERAALGYLHGNCGHCHNDRGTLAKVGLFLFQPVTGTHAAARSSTFRRTLSSPPAGLAPGTLYRIEPGQPARSALLQRVASRHPSLQMPPLATSLIDAQAVDLITAWITEAGIVSARDRHYARRSIP